MYVCSLDSLKLRFYVTLQADPQFSWKLLNHPSALSMRGLELRFSQPKRSALTTTLWDTPVFLMKQFIMPNKKINVICTIQMANIKPV